MSEKSSSYIGTITSLNKNFWMASFMELMERWAWYGIFGLLGIYLVESTDAGGLGFNHIQKGAIMGNVTAILYLLPLFFWCNCRPYRIQNISCNIVSYYDCRIVPYGRSKYVLRYVYGFLNGSSRCSFF